MTQGENVKLIDSVQGDDILVIQIQCIFQPIVDGVSG